MADVSRVFFHVASLKCLRGDRYPLSFMSHATRPTNQPCSLLTPLSLSLSLSPFHANVPHYFDFETTTIQRRIANMRESYRSLRRTYDREMAQWDRVSVIPTTAVSCSTC